MKFQGKEKARELRKRRNLELIRRMRDGDPLRSYDSQSSWFPPRPIIEKDRKALAKLYNNNSDDAGGGDGDSVA